MNQSWPVSQYCPLAAAVGPDRTANKDQPYQYSKSSLDDSGRAVGGAGLQSRAGLTTLENYNPLENYYPLEETIQLWFASMKWATMQQAGNFLPSFIWSRMDRLSMWSLDAFHLINYSSDWICPLESMLDCWSDDLPCWIFFEWTGTWAWYLDLITCYDYLAQWNPTWFGEYFYILCCSERMIWIFCMLNVSTGTTPVNLLITLDPLCNFIDKVLCIIMHIMVWLFEFFAWIVLCRTSSSIHPIGRCIA